VEPCSSHLSKVDAAANLFNDWWSLIHFLGRFAAKSRKLLPVNAFVEGKRLLVRLSGSLIFAIPFNRKLVQPNLLN
jgi:hypothetical protein